MKIKEKFDIKFSVSKYVNNVRSFFNKNLIKCLSFVLASMVSTIVMSFGVYSSSKATIDSAAITAANIAKDNPFQKVHIESKLSYSSDLTLSDSLNNNNHSFVSSHRIANQAFLNYSSAAFLTRNNFYTVAIDGNSEETKYINFNYTFADTKLSIKNITPSTNTVIEKTYTTSKYVDGALDNNFQMKRLRMETLDLYLLSNANNQTSYGYPVFLPDYVANKIVEENEGICTLYDCVGLKGTVKVFDVEEKVYIKNIIVTSAKEGDANDINDCEFTEGNVNYAKYLKNIYGNYSLMFLQSIFLQCRSMACADFNSEYFKIKSYLSNELLEIYSNASTSNVFSLDFVEDGYSLIENCHSSNTVTKALQCRYHKGSLSYFDGNITVTCIGLVFFVATLVFLYVSFASKRYNEDNVTWPFLLLSFIPLLVLNIFALVFLFIFAKESMFVGFYCSAFAVVTLLSFLLESVMTSLIYFLRSDN